ncbi:hypothetical protein B484DRAFT_45165 [Ochromonadaceae sp. CCMP2298]|nr:hypothetical protein B484DRAFT_45165 [Ochromonadaceae sp. CCMP2298]
MRSTITDRPNYIRAHARYKDLHDLLGNLSTKLTEVSKDVDQEFLSSYRVHMLSIQTEIKNLREDVDRGVMALKSDGNVAKLETEVNWFVEECTRLRLHFTTMENDCKQMQSRYKAMMEQKQYMNQQLKAILKRNRVLEAEIEYALNENQRSNKQEQDIATWSQQQDSAGQEEEVGFGGGEGDLDDEQEGGPMNFYQNHLVRESAKSPLSTTMFVPSPSGKRSSGSREGRVGSRSRSGSPTHPALHTSSTRGDMGEGGQSDNVLRELQGATDVLPILSNQASRLFKGESKPRSAKDNWEKKGEEKKKKMQRSKELLDEFLKHK